jgi:hypothetical protein
MLIVKIFKVATAILNLSNTDIFADQDLSVSDG